MTQRRHTTPGRALAAPSCAIAGPVHARPAPPRTKPMTPPGRAGLLPLPGARDHEVVWLSSPRVAHTPQRGSRVRPVHDNSGRLEKPTDASANRRVAGVRTGTAHSPIPDCPFAIVGSSTFISRSRAPSSAPEETPVSNVADGESRTPDRCGQGKFLTVLCSRSVISGPSRPPGSTRAPTPWHMSRRHAPSSRPR